MWPYEVPENWVWANVASVCEFERGITFPASAKNDEAAPNPIPCLRTANVQELLDLSDLIYIDKSYMKNNANKYVRHGDIIMSSANSRELVGKVSFVDTLNEEITFGGFVLAIRAKKTFDKYLFYYLRLEFLSGRFMGESTQTTNIANINATKLGGYAIPLPPLPEQHRIVTRIESLFTKLDRAKELAQSALDRFETRKAAILHQAFTGALTAQWRAAHGVGLDSWESQTIETICKNIVDCPHSTPQWTSEGKICLRTTNFRKGYLDLGEVRYVSEETYQARNKRLTPMPGDVLYSREGAILGLAVIYPEGLIACLGQRMMLMRANDFIKPLYLMHFLNSPAITETVKEKTGGSASPHINIRDIRKFVVPTPTFPEQEEIVRILDSLLEKEQRARALCEGVIGQVDLMKKAILARAFQGELGTNDASEVGMMGDVE